MSDLDIGIIDRRTVIIAIIVFILAGFFFQYPLPINTTSFAELFISIALLVGYVYLARSLVRLPFALFLIFPSVIRGIIDSLSDMLPGRYEEQPLSEQRSVFSKFFQLLRSTAIIVISVPFSVLLAPFFLGKFDEQAKVLIRSRYFARSITNRRYGGWMRVDPLAWLTANITRILDRTLLIGVLFFATVPTYQAITLQLGIAGLALMLLIFVLGGTFTYIVSDALEPTSQDKSTGRDEFDPRNELDRPSPISVYTSPREPVYVRVVTEASGERSTPVEVRVVNGSYEPVPVDVRNM